MIAVIILTAAITYLTISEINSSVSDQSELVNSKSQNNYKIKRLDGFKYVKPLMFVDDTNESEELSSIKQSLTGLIDNDECRPCLPASPPCHGGPPQRPGLPRPRSW